MNPFTGALAGALAAALLGWVLGSLVGREFFLCLYAAFWGAFSGVIFVVMRRKGAGWKDALGEGLRWMGLWHAMVCGMILGGGLLGASVFWMVGSLAGLDYSSVQLLRNGFHDGGFYLLIWAPGLSMVICVMLAHRSYSRKSKKSGGSHLTMDH